MSRDDFGAFSSLDKWPHDCLKESQAKTNFWLEILTQLLEIIGAIALIVGFVISTVRCIRQVRSLDGAQAFQGYRQAIGRTVLIGFEILVAATIIKTIILDPTLENIGLLAMMISIRTALGWSMFLEMNSRWPWKKCA